MKHGSLFSGIGGFDLAAEWMGWENVFHCEWNEFGQKVLKHYWPKAESFNDITKTDFTKYANKIDILTGGFPCQPYSSAGKRLGKEDERHLWPHMLRAIQEISPRYIVGENVRGLLNWNGGMVFDEVCVDLENNGYQVAPVIIPACGVNAPHRRERIWFVATNTEFKSTRSDRRTNNESKGNVWGEHTGNVFGTLRGDGVVADSQNSGHRGGLCERCANGKWQLLSNEQRRCEMGCEVEGCCGIGNTIQHAEGIGSQYALENRELEGGRFRKPIERNTWDAFPSQSPICGGNDGIPTRLDNITISNWRKESVKAYGNAIVPQVAFEIFKAIEQCEDAML
jgi:DNA (cytosine-5)-methyltransferase 1